MYVWRRNSLQFMQKCSTIVWSGFVLNILCEQNLFWLDASSLYPKKTPQICFHLICNSKTWYSLEVTELNWNFHSTLRWATIRHSKWQFLSLSNKSARNLFWRILVTLFKLKHICVEATQNKTHNGTHNLSHKNLQNHIVRKMTWAWKSQTGLSWETIIYNNYWFLCEFMFDAACRHRVVQFWAPSMPMIATDKKNCMHAIPWLRP